MGQQLHRLIRRKALIHLLQKLPQPLQGGLPIPVSGGPGDDSAQVQRRQIPCGGVVLQGFPGDGGQDVRDAGALVQTQHVQQPLRSQASLGHTLQQPIRELLHALLPLVLPGGLRRRLRSVLNFRVSLQEQPLVPGEGPAGHAVDFLRQAFQLRLDGSPV